MSDNPAAEFAADLIERCHNAERSLADLAVECPSVMRRNGLLMKREGVALVRGYIEESLRMDDARITVLEGASPGFGSYAESGLRKEGA
jgi:hypothetical protein